MIGLLGWVGGAWLLLLFLTRLSLDLERDLREFLPAWALPVVETEDLGVSETLLVGLGATFLLLVLEESLDLPPVAEEAAREAVGAGAGGGAEGDSSFFSCSPSADSSPSSSSCSLSLCLTLSFCLLPNLGLNDFGLSVTGASSSTCSPLSPARMAPTVSLVVEGGGACVVVAVEVLVRELLDLPLDRTLCEGEVERSGRLTLGLVRRLRKRLVLLLTEGSVTVEVETVEEALVNLVMGLVTLVRGGRVVLAVQTGGLNLLVVLPLVVEVVPSVVALSSSSSPSISLSSSFACLAFAWSLLRREEGTWNFGRLLRLFRKLIFPEDAADAAAAAASAFSFSAAFLAKASFIRRSLILLARNPEAEVGLDVVAISSSDSSPVISTPSSGSSVESSPSISSVVVASSSGVVAGAAVVWSEVLCLKKGCRVTPPAGLAEAMGTFFPASTGWILGTRELSFLLLERNGWRRRVVEVADWVVLATVVSGDSVAS